MTLPAGHILGRHRTTKTAQRILHGTARPMGARPAASSARRLRPDRIPAEFRLHLLIDAVQLGQSGAHLLQLGLRRVKAPYQIGGR